MIVWFVLLMAPPFSVRRGGVLVGAGDARVDLDQSVDVAGRVGPGLYLLQGPGEQAVRA
ncbi:hypothetical protein [Streptomyces sp. DSM 15324]|uniref:hypothetical protein n=1 Tax=Streptomyces sp. DSM 15324 TaxID=1739111 RepID=UPI000A57482F